SGFDTYHSTGLPPGPFVAPGQEAIEAALEPAEGEWLYFVATDPENGVTEFTDSYAEFEELKERFMEHRSGEECAQRFWVLRSPTRSPRSCTPPPTVLWEWMGGPTSCTSAPRRAWLRSLRIWMIGGSACR